MKKRIMAVVVTAAMVMGALAGCGSSSAKETQAPASTEVASETAAASETTGETEASDAASGDLTHVNVAYMANYASLWQVATAINKGYFKDEGLDVQLYMFQDGPTEIASMECRLHRTWRTQTVYQRSGRYLLLLTARQRRLCNGS